MLPIKPIQVHLNRFVQLLFADGWLFFAPYIFTYILFYYSPQIFVTEWNVSSLKLIFSGLHIVNLCLFIYYLSRLSPKRFFSDYFFWIGLLLIFLIPGAYLEYPSDPWDHFRRIFSWQTTPFLSSNDTSNKFTYFWGWTLLSGVPPIHRRFALDLYSTFWQLLLAYQFYLLALKLGFSKSWAKVQVIGTIVLFGTNLFSFRYYALSSTPLAYIAYIRSLIVIINVSEGNSKQGWLLLLLIPIIYFNHVQGLIWLIIGTIAVASYWINQKPKLKKLFWRILLPLFIVGYCFGWWLVHRTQFIGQTITLEYWLANPPYLSSWSTIRMWDIRLSHFQTLGVHGVLGLIFAFIFYRKHKLLSFLTLTPYCLLLFPPFVAVLMIIFDQYGNDGYTTYRLLYAFPTSFVLIAGLKESLNWILEKGRFYLWEMQQLIIVTLIIAVAALPPQFPYRGRLWFQLYKPPSSLSLSPMDRTAQWFFENRQLNSNSYIATDGATSNLLATQFNIVETEQRRLVYNLGTIIKTPEQLQTFIEKNQKPKICSFLVANPDQVPQISSSKVAELSGHWNPTIVKENLQVSPELASVTDSLIRQGWIKTFVPPFYWLYEPR